MASGKENVMIGMPDWSAQRTTTTTKPYTATKPCWVMIHSSGQYNQIRLNGLNISYHEGNYIERTLVPLNKGDIVSGDYADLTIIDMM